MNLGGASPLSPTIIVELKPQQTGTGLLIRYGEVATTSGSTTFLPGRLTAGHRPLKASVVVRIHPRQPIPPRAERGMALQDLGAVRGHFSNSLFRIPYLERPMVKQDHVSPTKRC